MKGITTWFSTSLEMYHYMYLYIATYTLYWRLKVVFWYYSIELLHIHIAFILHEIYFTTLSTNITDMEILIYVSAKSFDQWCKIVYEFIMNILIYSLALQWNCFADILLCCHHSHLLCPKILQTFYFTFFNIFHIYFVLI